MLVSNPDHLSSLEEGLGTRLYIYVYVTRQITLPLFLQATPRFYLAAVEKNNCEIHWQFHSYQVIQQHVKRSRYVTRLSFCKQ